MKLLTKEIENALPKLYATEGVPLEDKILQVKYFTPWTNWTWYGVEYDPESKTFFGYVQGIEDEWGYFNLDELESIKGAFGLKVERDLYFKPVAYKELIK
jgi:hypothetical protein